MRSFSVWARKDFRQIYFSAKLVVLFLLLWMCVGSNLNSVLFYLTSAKLLRLKVAKLGRKITTFSCLFSSFTYDSKNTTHNRNKIRKESNLNWMRSLFFIKIYGCSMFIPTIVYMAMMMKNWEWENVYGKWVKIEVDGRCIMFCNTVDENGGGWEDWIQKKKINDGKEDNIGSRFCCGLLWCLMQRC